MSALSRRGLLGAALALPGVAAAPADAGAADVLAGGPDAILLRLCAEFHRRQAVMLAACGTDRDIDGELGARNGVASAIAATPARTLAGHAAKADIAILWLLEHDRDIGPNADIRFAFAVLDDLVDHAAGADARRGLT